jgi:hypothetical protein
MERHCKADGCKSPVGTRYGRYCTVHKAQLRRHGAAGQKAITKADLKPYIGAVRARIEKNKGKALWSHLEGRWEALGRQAGEILEEAGNGVAQVRARLLAAAEIVKLSGAVEAQEVIETVLAMYLMQDQEPHRFKGDTAFRVQLVRRVRGLTSLNAKVWQQKGAGRAKKAYSEVPPRVSAFIGEWLSESFGAAGIHLAKLERDEREAQRKEQQAYFEALGEIA